MIVSHRILAVVLVSLAAAGAWLHGLTRAHSASGPLTLSVRTESPGAMFAAGAVGLSTETSQLAAGQLNAGRSSLVRMMRLLGHATLRIGGDSVDGSWWTSDGESPPAWATSTIEPRQLEGLSELLTAAGWRVLLGVDLAHFEPQRAAQEAREAQRILGPRLAGIEVGNEPNGYSGQDTRVAVRPAGYDAGDYLQEFAAYRSAIEGAAPGVPVDGPAVTGTRWIAQMGASASVFSAITAHYYPYPQGALCSSQSGAHSERPTVAELLSGEIARQQSETVSVLASAAALTGRPALIGETGTGKCDGDSPASATLAAALWALRWSLTAAQAGLQAVEFHGRFGRCEAENQTPICQPAVPSSPGALSARPEYYGLLAASRLEGGRFIPALLSSSATPIQAWATVHPGGTVTIALLNPQLGGAGQSLRISAEGYLAARAQTLTGPGASARQGVSLASAEVSETGRWPARSRRLRVRNGTLTVTLAPASAMLVTLTRR